MNAIGQGVIITRYANNKWQLEHVNPAFCHLVGKSEDDLIGRSMDDFFLPEDLPKLRQGRERRLNGETTFYEANLRRSDGNIIYVHLTGAPRWSDGNVVGSVSIITDLTESKRAEEREHDRGSILELLASDVPLTRILDLVTKSVEKEDPATLCSILLLDEDGRHLLHGAAPSMPDFYNQAIHGLEIGDGIGSCGTAAFTKRRVIVEDLMTHPYWDKFRELALKANVRSCWSEPIISADGQVLGTFAIYHRDIKSPSSQDILLIKSAADIARIAIERKRAEEALRSERDNAERYLNIAEVILVVLDNQARITLLNRKGYEVLGYDEGELIGKNWIETCLRPQDHQSVHEVNRKINAGELEAFEYYENYVLTKKGDERIIAWHTAIIRDEDGRITGTISSGEDITERKQTEEALEQSETKYRRLFENSPVGIISVSLDGKITEVNEALVEVMGSPSAEATKQLNVFEFPPMVEAGISECVKRCIQSGESVSYEHPYRSKWGKSLYLRLKLNPIHDAKGITTGVQSTVEDISKQKLAEDKLVTSLHEKEVLLKEIHHRVKNNLQVVSSLLGVQAHYAEDERLSGVLGECRNRVKSMALIHENLYKSEDLASVDFAKYICDLTKSLISSFGVDRRRIKLNLDLDQVPLSIDKAIPCGLIVNELVSNCLKHAFPGQKAGAVWVGLQNLYDKKVLLTVRDDGIGLPKSFEPQKSKTMGLRLVTDLVKQLKGEIQINHSGGTEFKIVFPAEI